MSASTGDAWALTPAATTPRGVDALLEAEQLLARLRALVKERHPASDLDMLLAGALRSETVNGAPVAGGRLALLRTREGTGLAARAVRGLGGIVTTVHGDDLLAFAPTTWSTWSPPLDALSRVAQSVLRAEAGAVVAISSAAHVAGDGPALLAQVQRLAELPLDERCRVADEHWAALLLRQLADQLGDALLRDCPLDRLRGLTGGLSAEFLGTLSLWLEADGDTLSTAQRMHLHPNTVRYRLRRVEAVSGLSLDDPAHRTLAWLTLLRQQQQAGSGRAGTNVRSMQERRSGSAS